MSDATPQTLIEELGQQLGLGPLRLDDQGFCALRFDDTLLINIQYWADGEQLVLFADLGPPAGGVKLYPVLLKANLFWRTTLGATLSLSEDDPPHVIIALQQACQSLDAGQLSTLLERFVNTVEDWTEVVKNATYGADLEDDDTLITSSDMSMMRV